MLQKLAGGRGLTREIPRLTLIEININHHRAAMAAPAAISGDLSRREVVADELVVAGVEPEPRRQLFLHNAQEAHGGAQLLVRGN